MTDKKRQYDVLPEVRNPGYGKLISVVNRAQLVRELWFQNKDTIRAIIVNVKGLKARKPMTIGTRGARKRKSKNPVR